MTEQWQELKETITEMRDNDGTGTQQEMCKFLVNLMEVLEKQMQEPSGDLISRQAVKEQMIKYGFHAPDMTVTEFVEDFLPVKQEPKTGHWVDTNSESFEFHRVYKCSECGTTEIEYPESIERFRYCPNCGAKMVEPQESEEV